jgi:hypothetical protein
MGVGSPRHDRRAAHASLVDGNALAGVLARLLGGDPTALVASCGACGAAEPLAAASVEVDDSVAIVRCRSCTHTLCTVVVDEAAPSLRIGALTELRVR